MAIKAVIFDFDGTLANTLPICFYAFQEVFKVFDDKNLSAEEIKAMFGPSETGIIRENLIHEKKDEAIELYYAKYAECHEQFVSNSVEINNLINYLIDNGTKLGIFTGKAKRSLDISLEALHMENIFDVMITGDDVDEPKPHPEGLIKTLSLLGVKNNEALFIGDSDADIEAGIRANVITVGVQWLPDYQSEVFVEKPDFIFNNVADFINALELGILSE